VSFEIVITTLVKGIKRKSTQEGINKPRTWGKFPVMRIKRRKNFIKSIVHVNDWTFDHFPLVRGK